MIHKIIKIKNVGKLREVKFGTPNWNGVLADVNAIYADNGSGKTTFTQILKSTGSKHAASKLLQKKSFNANGEIAITYLNGNKIQRDYNRGKWNGYVSKINVFDSYYIENNVYTIT